MTAEVAARDRSPAARPSAGRSSRHDVVIIGGGAGGIALAASLLRRRPELDLVIVEPRDVHDYQPGWTLVGGGVFRQDQTRRSLASVMPRGARRVRAAARLLRPGADEVVLEDGGTLGYRILVVATGLSLDWDGVDGLRDTLGRNGVTSNYLFELAPYTWALTRALRSGRALFTQPPMPIKCAGAPQKAMYLACDHWRRHGRLGAIDVGFHTATPVLFGVEDYVPALSAYVQRYDVSLALGSRLVAVDGSARRATFRRADGEVTLDFDMLHVCPPQKAPDIVAESGLAAASGFLEIDPASLRHPRHDRVFGIGDVCGTGNAKTAAAVRKQAPVAAINILAALDGGGPQACYEGYGACPLTVERGKVVLAEFGYGGVLQPSLPTWLIDGRRPSRLGWLLKTRGLPWIYWHALLRGREWLARPRIVPVGGPVITVVPPLPGSAR